MAAPSFHLWKIMILINKSSANQVLVDHLGESHVILPGGEIAGPDNYLARYLVGKGSPWRVKRPSDIKPVASVASKPVVPKPEEIPGSATNVDVQQGTVSDSDVVVSETDLSEDQPSGDAGEVPAIDATTLEQRSLDELRAYGRLLGVRKRSRAELIEAIRAALASKAD